MKPKNIISNKIVVFLLLVMIVPGVVFIKPQPAKAFIVEDVVNLAVNIKDTVWNLAKSAVEHSASVLFKNTTRYFLNNLAYNAATAIVEGGTGKTPLFPKLQPGQLLEQAAGDALGEFIDGAIGEAGLENFDICNPGSLQTTLNILMPSFREVDPNAFTKDSPYQAKCHWQDIKKNWSEFADAARKDPSKYLFGLKAQFKDGANDLDISTQVNSRLLDSQQESKLEAQLNVVANQYINPIVSPISKFIKTPASIVSGSFQSTIDNSTQAETTFTGDLFADALGIFTNTLAAKLQKKIMQGLDDNSMPTSKVTLSQINSVFGGSTKKGVDQFADFRKVNAVRADGAGMDAFEKFSSEKLPMQGDNSLAKGPGPTSEVLPDFVLMAARQELTLKQSIDQGIIPADIQFGFSKQRRLTEKVSESFVDEDIKNDDGSWSSALSYRGLLIGRTQRLFPQSWELAALYWRYYDDKSSGPLSIQSVMDCFADTNTGISPYGTRYNEDPRYPEKCRRDMNGDGDIEDLNPMDDYNPYFHLVDPNWVLRLPATKCVAKGPGTEKVYESTQCIEDNVDAGPNAIVGGQLSGTAISRGEGTPICDADQAKKLGIKTEAGIKYDIPTKIVTRDDNYCADWQSCVKEDGNGNCVAYGYCVEEKPIKKLSASSCSFPKNSNNGLYSSCNNFQIGGNSYNLVKNTLKKCNDTDAGCKQYSTSMKANTDGGLDWDFSSANSSVFLNSNAESCDKTNDGCTKVASYQNGINLIYNGDFTKTKVGTNLPTGWVTESEDICEFEQKFNGENGASLTTDGVGECALINETPALITSGYDYLLSYKVKTEQGVSVSFEVTGVDNNGAVVKTENISATSSADWITVTKKITLGEGTTNEWTFPLNTKGLRIKIIHSQNAGKVGFNELALVVVNGPLVDVTNINQENSVYNADYTRANLTAYKLPPKYLKCELFYQKLGNYSEQECKTKGGVWNKNMLMCAVGGRSECDNYAPLCSAQDVGCQLFKSTDGYFDVPAKVSGDDICPNECINYNSYSRQPSFFEANELPSLYTTASSCQQAGGNWDAATSACQAQPKYVNLIPTTANQCSAAAVGCQSFTNLSASTSGGENKEYFSFLRPCVTETTTAVSKVFYTWEGSDTSGYQLKKWTRLVSNVGSGPCTNVDAETGACLDTGNGNVWSAGNGAGNRALCSGNDITDNPDCRDFFDINDKHYFVYQSKTVTARQPKSADACVSFRNDLTGKIYNADPSDAVRCTAAEVSCRMFKGGVSNNVRTVVETKFEDGVLGDWKNSNQGTDGLTIYNDALRQGESSLLAYVSNHKISFKKDNNFIEDNKEYTLVMLAKKVTMPTASQPTFINEGPNPLSSLITKAHAQTVQEPMVFSYEGNLQNEWREYRIGPIAASDFLNNEIQIKIKNLGNKEAFAIDEVRLIEGRDVYYLIDNTWNTPVSCDNVINNLEGCDANGENCGERRAEGAQLGCQAYTDKNNNTVAIKAFTQLCSPTAVNCQAFINTNNSETPAAYNKTNICDANSGVIKGDACVISGIEVCKLNGGSSCQYSSAFVPSDNITYFVPEEKYACDSKYAGCMSLGKPGYDLTVQPAVVKKFDTVYLLNNPDKYSQTLCGANGLMCELMVSSDGSQGVYVSPIGVDSATSRICVYDSGKERWVQKSDPEKNCEIDNPVSLSNRSKYMTTADNVNYRGWVGMCEDSYVGCNEYRNPEQSLTAGANWCDASINASDYGICNTSKGDTAVTTADSKKFCQKKISGVNHLVCELLNGQTECNYTASDWTCYGQEKMNKGMDENSVCQINGNDVCVIKSNLNGVQDTLSCSYSPLCESSFAISSTVKQCSGGQVDRSSGCAPFYDVSGKSASAASKATKDKGVLVTCDESAKPGEEKYCNTNVVLENHLSRQCSEWLYCTSSAKVGDKNVCLDVGRCAEADSSGKCIKPSAKTSLKVKNQTFDFNNIFDRENVRYSTGYSRTGLTWSSKKAIEGFASPESMKQSSNNASLVNSDFEEIPAMGMQINGWVISGDDNCSIDNNDYTKLFDGKNAWDGYYSIKLSKPGDKGFCELTSNGGTVQGPNNDYYLPINPKRRYVLSYAARSSNGTQLSVAGMKFYDSVYDECSFVMTPTNFNKLPAAKRGKYKEIGSYDDQKMYYNRYCVDKNGTTNLIEAPGWVWGYSVKADKIKNEWMNYSVTFDPGSTKTDTEMPSNVSYAKLVFFTPHHAWGTLVGSSGDIWLDDIKLDSSLQLSEGKYVTSMCRLYPSADAKQCSYTKLNRKYNGWQGYCLEEDPYVPGQCLQWFPVDSVAGDGLNSDDEEIQAYDNRSSLYMCVASTGIYETELQANTNSKLCQETWQEAGISFSPQGLKISDVYSAEIWLEKTSCQDYNTDDWSNMNDKSKKLIPGYYNENGKKLPVLWWGGGQANGVYHGTEDNWGGYAVGSFSDWWNRKKEGSCLWGNNCNSATVGIRFNEDGTFKDVLWYTQDGSGDTGGLKFHNLHIYLKENCRLMAKVVNDNGENKVMQNTYNGGWRINNPMGYSKTTPGSPYGSLIFEGALANKEPSVWGSSYVPFEFDSIGDVGLPLYSLRNVSSNSGSAYCKNPIYNNASSPAFLSCEGTKTSDSSISCNYCSGVGKYRYNGNTMTTNRCDVDGGDDCFSPKELHPNDLGGDFMPANNIYKVGIDRLKNLFAKVYGWYELVVQEDKSVYRKIGPNDNPNLYNDISNGGQSGVISGVKVGDNSTGNVNINAPGDSVIVSFKVDIPNEQLPIRKLIVDWGDGTQQTDFTGEFNERNSDGNPFTFSHWYGCVPTADGNRCRQCTKANVVPNPEGACVYDGPKVLSKDNWEWCAVAENQSLNNLSKYGPGSCSGNGDDFVQYDAKSANRGKIIVRPRQ